MLFPKRLSVDMSFNDHPYGAPMIALMEPFQPVPKAVSVSASNHVFSSPFQDAVFSYSLTNIFWEGWRTFAATGRFSIQ